MPDVAMIRPDAQYGAVILYNPIACQQIGPACGFVRAHEYGHYVYQHQFQPPGGYNGAAEQVADCWAAQNGVPAEILAAYQLFMMGGSSTNWMLYGNPQERALRIRSCAIAAGRWLGA